jgi:hypothetical protein
MFKTLYMDQRMKIIYPLTICLDRYTGVYSGGKYTAWNLHSHEVPEDIHGDDTACMNFFDETEIIYGRGDTPNDAINDLERRMTMKNKNITECDFDTKAYWEKHANKTHRDSWAVLDSLHMSKKLSLGNYDYKCGYLDAIQEAKEILNVLLPCEAKQDVPEVGDIVVFTRYEMEHIGRVEKDKRGLHADGVYLPEKGVRIIEKGNKND